MHTTSPSLLERLRCHRREEDWERFVAFYTPLLCLWARRLGVAGADVEDVVQDVMAILVAKLPEFVYDPQQRLRGWLWTILANKVRQRHRRAVAVAPLTDSVEPVAPDWPGEADEAEYRQFVVQRALELIRGDFQTPTWEAFQAVSQGEPPAQVAARLGMNVASVYAARSRVLKRMREEVEGLLD